MPPISVLAVVALAVCVTPAAFGAPGLQLLYLIPLAILWWVLRRRTMVDSTGIQVRELFSSTRVDWPQVRGLRLGRNSSVHLVHENDAELALPLMRTRDLPLLAALSGGRLPDPTAADLTGPDPTAPDPTSPDPTADSDPEESSAPAIREEQLEAEQVTAAAGEETTPAPEPPAAAQDATAKNA
ncbi:Bacterial PH domain [Actinoalloteichus hymeniacidonis]|uniref:Bacterial PH domain n=1 Tax=Actinoalloteichus hymeniacidonis TaxID=340345 RepID=A0AAC9HTR5_9PSEU|nr:Bacterial PH domain [Actinoalloteichus hymeniacidonis]